MQLQMLLGKKKKGLLCVASPDFENYQKVDIYEVDLQEDALISVMENAKDFWNNFIFPLLCLK